MFVRFRLPILWGRLLHSIRDRLAEWSSATIMASCGVLLGFNPAMLDGRYSYMLQIAAAETWMFVFAGVGFVRLAILGINGALVRSPHFRAGLSFLSAMVWLQVVLTYLVAPGALSFGLAVFPILAVTDVIAMLRAASDAARVDKRLADGRNES